MLIKVDSWTLSVAHITGFRHITTDGGEHYVEVRTIDGRHYAEHCETKAGVEKMLNALEMKIKIAQA